MTRPDRRRRALLGLLLLGALGIPAAEARAEKRLGWLGISIAEVGEEMSERLASTYGYAAGTGVYVADVLKDGPAERGALRRGDVIVRLDDQPVWEIRQLQRLIRLRPIHQSVTLTVLRDGARVRLPVVIGAMPATARAQLAGERFGFLVREEFERDTGGGGPRPTGRIFVAFVDDGSAAAHAGLRPQDLILEANRQPVRDLESFERILGASESRLALVVERKSVPTPLPLRLELPLR